MILLTGRIQVWRIRSTSSLRRDGCGAVLDSRDGFRCAAWGRRCVGHGLVVRLLHLILGTGERSSLRIVVYRNGLLRFVMLTSSQGLRGWKRLVQVLCLLGGIGSRGRVRGRSLRRCWCSRFRGPVLLLVLAALEDALQQLLDIVNGIGSWRRAR